MKRIAVIALFIIGLAFAVLLNGITYFDWFGTDFFFPIIFFGTFLIALVLAIIGIGSKSRERWIAILMASLVLLGFSLGYLYSLGFILAPAAIVFVIISILRLAKKPS